MKCVGTACVYIFKYGQMEGWKFVWRCNTNSFIHAAQQNDIKMRQNSISLAFYLFDRIVIRMGWNGITMF